MVCSLLVSIHTSGWFNSKGCTRRGGVNSDHTVNGVSTEQSTLKQAL